MSNVVDINEMEEALTRLFSQNAGTVVDHGIRRIDELVTDKVRAQNPSIAIDSENRAGGRSLEDLIEERLVPSDYNSASNLPDASNAPVVVIEEDFEFGDDSRVDNGWVKLGKGYPEQIAILGKSIYSACPCYRAFAENLRAKGVDPLSEIKMVRAYNGAPRDGVIKALTFLRENSREVDGGNKNFSNIFPGYNPQISVVVTANKTFMIVNDSIQSGSPNTGVAIYAWEGGAKFYRHKQNNVLKNIGRLKGVNLLKDVRVQNERSFDNAVAFIEAGLRPSVVQFGDLSITNDDGTAISVKPVGGIWGATELYDVSVGTTIEVNSEFADDDDSVDVDGFDEEPVFELEATETDEAVTADEVLERVRAFVAAKNAEPDITRGYGR